MPPSLAAPAVVPIAQAEDISLENWEPPPAAHALVIGHRTLETLCGLIRRGCAGAVELRPYARVAPPPDTAEVVVLPDPASPDEAAASIAMAWRALSAGGQILVRAPSGRRREIEALLRRQGFAAISGRETERSATVFARRPFAFAHS